MKSPNRRGALAYQGGIEAVVAILVGTGLGFWADQAAGTTPVGTFVGLAVGFGAFILRIVRLSRRLEELRIEEEGDEPPRPLPPEAWDDPWDAQDKDDW